MPAVPVSGTSRRRLAVLGSPIAHSLSPRLHRVAYDLLELPFDYGSADVPSGSLGSFLADLDDSWLGLSLTMPLKREVIPLLDSTSDLVKTLGVANTVVLDGTGGGRHLAGHNTDVDGITRALRSRHDLRAPSVGIIGGGATAASALAAAVELGSRRVTLFLRDVSRAGDLVTLASTLDVPLKVQPLDRLDGAEPSDVVISTLPGGAADALPLQPTHAGAVLLDVAYDPWPTIAATRWVEAGGAAVSGLDMLVEQAIGQIRLFTGLDHEQALPAEDDIRRAMRREVGLDATEASEVTR